ncbi:hypothetical protein [Burkholderia vietnamiensis]|uniref:hypothetical protein n=1 Tax=Burkholderia vietnamiensis TaxID=60552 RepID=UPI000A464ADE|nr:hypothetical protein [Burkholderia vietnamiensis]
MADYLTQAQNNFSRLDLGKIQQLVSSISDNAERATRFVTNPDAFIRDELPDEKISPHLPCHVRIGDRTHLVLSNIECGISKPCLAAAAQPR